MTNASVERVLEIEAAKPRRPSRRALAKAAFLKAEAKRDAYLRMALTLDHQSIAAKVSAAESLAEAYRSVTVKKDPELTLASWVRIAELYLHFAEQIRTAKGAEASELAAMAVGPELRAREAWARGRTHAQAYGVRGTWRARLERLTHDPRLKTQD